MTLSTHPPQAAFGDVTLPNTRLHYVKAGMGPPLIIVPATISLIRQWLPLTQFMGQRFTSYFFELPGHGGSTPYPERFESQLVPKTVEGFVNSLGYDKFNLMGFSFGGLLALRALEYLQDRIEKVILLSIQTAPEVPEVVNDERMEVERLAHGFVRVVARYGFMESPDVKEIMELLRRQGVRSRPLETSYYLGREQLIPLNKPWKKNGLTMNVWRKRLFAVLAKNAMSAAEFFQLPPNRVVELGTQIEF